MNNKNNIFSFTLTLFVSFILTFSIQAQELPVEDPEKTVIDTIDYNENLLDSNQAYKQEFDSLSKDGEWVEIDKSEFLHELTESTGEELDFDGDEQTTKVIYVWRPYNVDYNSYWNPYLNGNWVFTNFGWVWSSYYSWGWAPYNYGRWYCSNNYGWVWFPGRVWAPNYVSWRNCGNYAGWYPTCPRFYWKGRGTSVYTNHLFAYTPKNWVFVNKKDFTKKIDKTIIVKSENNAGLLKRSEKIDIAVYKDPNMAKFKYSGPDATSVSKASGVKILPAIVTRGESGGNILNQKINTQKTESTLTTKDDKISNNSSEKKNSDSKTKKPVKKSSNTKGTRNSKESIEYNSPEKSKDQKPNEKVPNTDLEKKNSDDKSEKVSKDNKSGKSNSGSKDDKINNGPKKIR